MSVVTVEKDRYTVEPLYQWDINQVLEIRGLSLSFTPEIHFANTDMERAIVRQATVDSAGVITADIPNSLLQDPYPVAAFVCGYEGETFATYYRIDIPVKARNKPSDYTIEDSDEEIYSFNALENKVNAAVSQCEQIAENSVKECEEITAEAVANCEATKTVIEDNLTSDSSTSALSAAQGKILNESKQKKISYGTEDPSGGADGDIYIKYQA